MGTIEQIKSIYGNKKDRIMKQYRIKEIALIGSVTDEELAKSEDINMFVEFASTPDMFEFSALEYHLTALFGKKVDLFTNDSISFGKTWNNRIVYI